LKVSFLLTFFFLKSDIPKKKSGKKFRERERGMCVEKDLPDATIDFII
jgi:hypothetical protein